MKKTVNSSFFYIVYVARNWLPFSTPRNISYSFHLKHSFSFPLIRLRVSCDATFISFAKKPHVSVHRRVERVRVMIWSRAWDFAEKLKIVGKSCNFDVHTLLIKASYSLWHEKYIMKHFCVLKISCNYFHTSQIKLTLKIQA